ncbi:SDR family oxidoreductase [Flavobacterium eburneipallidum]|uniref:SDR family oxidoreductase n=1 Tax=Flavobacterium eburneipallidum TaxID=3003263 RepID=UPI0022AC46FC|nr:aldehyde reductase [Flavobacterium eburneipallidum]
MNNLKDVLVTGGNGFVGMQIILQLLKKGYFVKTTIRSIKSKDAIIETLEKNGFSDFSKLSFIEAELTKDDNWSIAMQDCKYVLSVASPVFLENPKDEKEAIKPAVEGVLRILKHANKAGVKRVIMTSNFGAVGFSQTDKNRVTTEDNWTDVNLKGLSVYEKSKTLAEKAAWEYIENNGGNLEFVTINPVAILGPSLNSHVSESFGILRNLLDGSMKAVPNIPLNIVDVRDVADLHIRAMLAPEANGHRFIASADGQISMPEIAAFIKKYKPEIANKVTTKIIPNFILRVASLFNSKAKQGVMFLNINRNVSNQKAKNILGWSPISTNENAIIASIESLVKYEFSK